MTEWYQLTTEAVLAKLDSDAQNGLSRKEASRRLEEYGPNEMVEQELKSPWLILWEQLTSTLVLVLLAACIVSALLGDHKDAAVILAIVSLNAFLGLRQEYRAERAMAALKRLTVPVVKARREGHVQELSARELVPGDLILLEAGTLVPADGRLLEAANLSIQESALTGESEPVAKREGLVYQRERLLGDRRNMAFMGTAVTRGRGTLVVTQTGMATELGRIAELIQKVESQPTPLQRRLDRLGKILAAVALILVTVIFVLGILRGEELRHMFLTAVSLAVAAVPEGLPAVVTIALALGAQRMLKRQALIRKLPAVETLGSVTVICSDKTGTLTQNRMTVTILEVAGQRIDLTETGIRTPATADPSGDGLASLQAQPALALLLVGGALCNDAMMEQDDEAPGGYRLVGDPTEAALVVAAARHGLVQADLNKAFRRIREVPFDSERKRMTTVHRWPQQTEVIPSELSQVKSVFPAPGTFSCVAFSKGALASLLNVSNRVWSRGADEDLDGSWRNRIIKAHDSLAARGMRVLGVALRLFEEPPLDMDEPLIEQDLVFIGLVGMIDPPREEVKEAVGICQAAGIRTVMITGDHQLTARYIAGQLGMAADSVLLSGSELNQLSEDELGQRVLDVGLYARVSPEHKLDIVRALQRHGQIVAMTGDGVNDAPALRKADIGISMGIAGTDVAKEASDMVLQDDNFATIVAAVEEGRVIFDNMRKFIMFLLAANSGELWVMLLGPLLGMPLPLLPLQILWMNLITDGPPALALGIEPAEPGVMQRPPVSPSQSLFGRNMARDIVWIGVLMGLISLGVGHAYWQADSDSWQTMVFTTLTFSQMSLAMAVRSQRNSLFALGFLTNKPLVGAVAASLSLQLAVVYLPFLRSIFSTTSLSIRDLASCLASSALVLAAVELKKWLTRRLALRADRRKMRGGIL